MLADIADLLACPVCRAGLTLAPGALRCPHGHTFDVARQGYANLLTGSRVPGTADTPAMVAARDRFLGEGHYTALAGRLARVVREALPEHGGAVLDVGAGTGHYLAAVLTGTARGVALDVSKYAARRAARAHPRIGAVVADVWRGLPVRDAAIDVLINVFAPRSGPEFARVLKRGGRLVVVTPGPGHLRPLVDLLGLLGVEEDKDRRVRKSLGDQFTEIGGDEEEITLSLGHAAVEAVVMMGPNAWHEDLTSLRRKILALPDPMTVTAVFHMSIFECA